MKAKGRLFLAMGLGLLLVSVPLFAHHGRVGYDNQKILTLKGTITSFEWSNPHIQIHFDAPNEKGVMTHWSCEAQNPFSQMRAGWTKDEFKPGDQVTITIHPAKNGNGVGLFMSAILANGQKATYGAGAE
jgi:hypothetical protein